MSSIGRKKADDNDDNDAQTVSLSVLQDLLVGPCILTWREAGFIVDNGDV